MFHWLYDAFYDPDSVFSFLRLFNYISSRVVFASVTALTMSIILGKKGILMLFRSGMTDRARDHGVMDVSSKRGTPTMGGVFIVISTASGVLLWCNLANNFVLLLLAALVWYASLGILDDVLKNRHRDAEKGLSRWSKFCLQAIFALVAGVILYHPSTSPLPPQLRSVVLVPFVKSSLVDLGWGMIFWSALIITFAANAVNFADGLDGLAVVPALFVAVVYGIFAYVLGNQVYSSYLHFQGIPGVGEITIFCAALAGAAVGFLWYNAYPAEVFMGDAGAMTLGGVLGTLATMLRQEVLFFLAGGIFVAEMFSVVLQDWVGIKLLKRRIIYRAPLHHSFQYMGIAETKIAVRFWIISGMLMLLSLASLKIR